MSKETDHSMDGIDPDAREQHPVGWRARQLCQDLKDLREMSEADLKHYAGTPSFSQKSKTRGVNGY